MTIVLGIIFVLAILVSLFIPAPVTSTSETLLSRLIHCTRVLALAGLALSCVDGYLILGVQIALWATTAFMIVVWTESGPHLPDINWAAFDAARSFWSEPE